MLLAPSVSGLFKWRQFEPEVILMAVGWYLRFSLSYRDVEELLAERGLHADHVRCGAGYSVTPRKWNDVCARGSNRPTTEHAYQVKPPKLQHCRFGTRPLPRDQLGVHFLRGQRDGVPAKLLNRPFPAGLAKAFSQFRIAHQHVDFFGEGSGKLVRVERLKGAFRVLFQWHQEPGLPVCLLYTSPSPRD